jgi:hypothetical protein
MKQKKALAYLVLGAVMLFTAVSSALASSDSRRINQEGCPPPGIPQEDGSCYFPPEEPPPPEETAVPVPDSPPSDPSWEGYSDGRLNPDMAEYYSVWCQDNFVLVMRGVPRPEIIVLIPLADVNAMSDGSSMVVTGDVTVSRSSHTITLSGNNGNLAPQFGSKSFSLWECNARNGGAPPSNSVPPSAPQNSGNDPNAFDASRCLDQLFLNAHLIECGDAPDNSISWLWRRIDEICPGSGIVPLAFTSVVLFRNRRKRK